MICWWREERCDTGVLQYVRSKPCGGHKEAGKTRAVRLGCGSPRLLGSALANKTASESPGGDGGSRTASSQAWIATVSAGEILGVLEGAEHLSHFANRSRPHRWTRW